PLGGDVLALNDAGQLLVVDAREIKHSEVIGTFDLATGPGTNAAIAQGQLWVSGSQSARFELQRQSTDVQLLYEDGQPKGLVESVALIDGVAVGTTDYYGLQMVENEEGEYLREFVPGARAEPSHQIVKNQGTAYVRQDDDLLVKAIDIHNSNKSTNLLVDENVSHIIATDDYLVASQLGELIFKTYDGKSKGRLTVEIGNEIVSLASRANTVYAGTQSGAVYRVRIGGLPILEAETEITLLLAANSAVRQLSVSGDYLIYALGSDIVRLRLDDLELRTITLAEQITSIETHQGVVFIAGGTTLRTLDLESWALMTNEIIASAAIESIALEHNRLLLGLGSDGMALYELPLDWLLVNPSLAQPHFAANYEQTDLLYLSLENVGNLNAVQFSINGNYNATQLQLPFNENLRIPALLRNGQPFGIQTKVESIWGDIAVSREREVMLQSLDQVVNDIGLVFDQSDIYLPLPLEMRAFIQKSSQPIEQVEFYYSASNTGPWEIIGKHYGPEYVVYRNFDLSQHGHFVKARAIDIYGNVKETEPLQIQRLADNNLPTAEYSLSGTLVQGSPVGGHPFAVNVALEDSESGIDYALLKRDGVLVAAAFGEEDLQYSEALAVAGQVYNYEVTVLDHSGNQSVVAQNYTAVPDMLPVIGTVAVPATVREQSSFDVTVDASDDLAVKSISVEWTGHIETIQYQDSDTTQDATFSLSDLRTARVGADQIEQLRVTVTDSLNQSSESLVDITVVSDQVPDTSGIGPDVPISAFFDGTIRIQALNLQNADDGEKLTVEIFEQLSNGRNLINRVENTSADTVKAVGRRNLIENNDTDYQVVVRITDELGQSAETSPVSVILTQRPNYLEYVRPFDSDVNPSFIEAGQTITLNTRVTDVANRPVPNQVIRWYFRNLDTGEETDADTTGTSDLDGIAALSQVVRLKTGNYRVYAKLQDPDFDAIAAAIHVVQVMPGAPAQIVVEQISPTVAGTAFEINLEVQDAGGNQVNVGRASEVLLAINEPRYQVGFSSNIDISYFSDHVEFLVSLSGGRQIIEMVASTIADTYQLTASYPDTALKTLYDHDGQGSTEAMEVTEIDMVVVNAPPTDMRIEIVSVDNQIYGDEQRLEIDEVVHLQLRLIDVYGNTVETLVDNQGVRSDANYQANMNTTGAALVNSIASTQALNLVQGKVEFTLIDSTVETVNLSLTELAPIADGFNSDPDFAVEFLPLRPYIADVAFDLALDDTQPGIVFTFSEEIELAASADWSVKLDGNAQLVDLAVVSNKLNVALTEAIELNRCYDYDTSTLEATATLTELERLTQTAQVCSPQAAIPAQTSIFGLENAAYDVAIDIASDIAFSGISNGIATVEGVDQAFDWDSRQLILPEITSRNLDDGHEITVYLEGTLQSEALRLANGISLRVLKLEGDYDGDGLSNALEVALGLSATNVDSNGDGVFDGEEDHDSDGLTNLEEVNLGTDAAKADTDGDGLSDGDEVNVYGTDPLLADTDGDGVNDNIELHINTNPLDENDFDISPFVTALQLTPDPITGIYKPGADPMQTTLSATLTVDVVTYTVDVSHNRFGASFVSQDVGVVEYL
ncbi:MAG: hypothetical protein GY935_06495, partial [Gammaproteobacteria bacterium]|nr:hypothetical protein [Gammaproteobacteria bacterium]